MSDIFVAHQHNPYQNIAFEYELFRNYQPEKGIVIFLWVNEPCIILGRNQNYYEEVNTQLVREHHVQVVRRLSGGGAVYHDYGNLNFTFIYGAEQNINPAELIQNALRYAGIHSIYNERNDMLIDGKKISGQSQLIEDNKVLFHGTLLVNVDLDLMNKLLTPSAAKLSSHQISSVRSRVINLREKYSITVKSLLESLVHFYTINYAAQRKTCDYKHLALLKQLQSEKWIYQENANFDVAHEFKTKIGQVSFRLQVHNGIIKNVHIFSDAYLVNDFQPLIEQLTNQEYNQVSLEKYLLTYIDQQEQ